MTNKQRQQILIQSWAALRIMQAAALHTKMCFDFASAAVHEIPYPLCTEEAKALAIQLTTKVDKAWSRYQDALNRATEAHENYINLDIASEVPYVLGATEYTADVFSEN